ncbi:SAM-dependent methyltransferase [Halalkalibacter lacteus]|uniref:SAM-dependent methyltransferase n=1 Tax=Halalkalibacter lacteus TaxID=3090663 RepID=UPI002FC8F2F4
MSRVEEGKKLDLERIIFIGRTFEEYLDMFSLSVQELKGKKILDCPAGACSFTAMANTLGMDVTACDIAYYHSIDNLEKKGYQDIEHAMEQMEHVKNKFVWDYFKNIEGLRMHRVSALKSCANSMRESSERYVPVTLPTLPFQDEEFDILLSAHFLFTYADRLDYDFHKNTIHELVRVSKEEIRIFPLVDLAGNRYQHLDRLKQDLMDIGCIVEEMKVPYEFQANAHTMLKITKNQN